jgi:hypothetical protein
MECRKCAANNRLQLRKAPALPQGPAILHRGEQRIVEALHGTAAAGRRGMHSSRKAWRGQPLIGADLMHLREIEQSAVGLASIGGAGTFDGISFRALSRPISHDLRRGGGPDLVIPPSRPSRTFEHAGAPHLALDANSTTRPFGEAPYFTLRDVGAWFAPDSLLEGTGFEPSVPLVDQPELWGKSPRAPCARVRRRGS